MKYFILIFNSVQIYNDLYAAPVTKRLALTVKLWIMLFYFVDTGANKESLTYVRRDEQIKYKE